MTTSDSNNITANAMLTGSQYFKTFLEGDYNKFDDVDGGGKVQQVRSAFAGLYAQNQGVEVVNVFQINDKLKSLFKYPFTSPEKQFIEASTQALLGALKDKEMGGTTVMKVGAAYFDAFLASDYSLLAKVDGGGNYHQMRANFAGLYAQNKDVTAPDVDAIEKAFKNVFVHYHTSPESEFIEAATQTLLGALKDKALPEAVVEALKKGDQPMAEAVEPANVTAKSQTEAVTNSPAAKEKTATSSAAAWQKFRNVVAVLTLPLFGVVIWQNAQTSKQVGDEAKSTRAKVETTAATTQQAVEQSEKAVNQQTIATGEAVNANVNSKSELTNRKMKEAFGKMNRKLNKIDAKVTTVSDSTLNALYPRQ